MRRIVCAADFDIIAAGIFGELSRVDDLISAVEWTLAREISFEDYPVIGNAGGRKLLAYKVRGGLQYPAAIFLFTVEEETVYLVSVITADDRDTS